jgi:hypothetical protein
VFVAFTLVTWLPVLQAYLLPPAGTRLLAGTLIYQTDFCQHLSFVEQATRGAWLFENKFDTRPQPPFVANLEWWAAGRLAWLFGRGPIFGFYALGTLATLALLAAVARALVHAGVREGRFAWALALFATGGGFGWIRWLQGAPLMLIPDLSMAVYPWTQRLMGSAHALVGTSLLLWTILLFAEWRTGRRGRAGFLLCGTALGLTRPFDLLLFEAVALSFVLIDIARRVPVRQALERGLTLLWLLPVSVYCLCAFYLHPSFDLYTRQNDTGRPPLFELFMALVPAATLALVLSRRALASPEAAVVARSLGLCSVAAVVLMFMPGGFGFQFVNALGSVLLLLVGMRLPAGTRGALLVLLLVPSSAASFRVYMTPGDGVFSKKEWTGVVDFLRAECRPGDVVYSRFGVGSVVAALTPCSVTHGHHVLVPDYRLRQEEDARFFDPRSAPVLRRGLVDVRHARFVVVPPEGEGWLGAEAPFDVRLRSPVASVLERRPGLVPSGVRP